MLLLLATCLTKSDRGPRNSSWLRARFLRLSLALAFSTMQKTVRFCSVPTQFRVRKAWGSQGHPTTLPFPQTSREDLGIDGYLEYPHAAKALYIYKHPCLLWDSNPGPTAPQSASLTSILVGRWKYFVCISSIIRQFFEVKE
ncbi:uncharacterized protein TNCV_2931461 [Trichonephila clavipes]|nr:uncharacterized protein TNCV_2931461 [Trichonephila clavipes]